MLLLQSELPDNHHLHPHQDLLPQLVEEEEEGLSTTGQEAWWYAQNDEVGVLVEEVKVKEQEVVVEQVDQLEGLEDVQDVQEVVQLAQEAEFELEVEYHHPPLAQAQMKQNQSQKAL